MEGHKERKIERTVKDEKRRESNERKFKTIKYNWGMKTVKKTNKQKTKDNVQNPIFAHCPLFFLFFYLTSPSKKKRKEKINNKGR